MVVCVTAAEVQHHPRTMQHSTHAHTHTLHRALHRALPGRHFHHLLSHFSPLLLNTASLSLSLSVCLCLCLCLSLSSAYTCFARCAAQITASGCSSMTTITTLAQNRKTKIFHVAAQHDRAYALALRQRGADESLQQGGHPAPWATSWILRMPNQFEECDERRRGTTPEGKVMSM